MSLSSCRLKDTAEFIFPHAQLCSAYDLDKQSGLIGLLQLYDALMHPRHRKTIGAIPHFMKTSH